MNVVTDYNRSELIAAIGYLEGYADRATLDDLRTTIATATATDLLDLPVALGDALTAAGHAALGTGGDMVRWEHVASVGRVLRMLCWHTGLTAAP